MSTTIPESWLTLINRLHQTGAWLWCWELEADVSTTARTVFRLVSHDQPVILPDFKSALETSHQSGGAYAAGAAPLHTGSERVAPGTGTGADAKFYPFPIAQSELRQSGAGDLPTMTLTLDNTARVLTRWFHTGDGFINRGAAAVLVNLTDLTKRVQFTMRVQGAAVNARTATLQLEMPNFMQRDLPEDRHDAARCDSRFGGPLCGYPVNDLAGFFDCPKTFAACVARGEDEKARNLPVLHPQRFNAFVGTPNQ